MCGIIPDDQEVYKYLNKIAANEIEEEDECPPPPRKKEERERFNCDSSEDSEEENKDGEWIRVAGDGACPSGGNKDTDYREAEAAYIMERTTDTIAVGKIKVQHRVHREQRSKQHGDGLLGHGLNKFTLQIVPKSNTNWKE